MAGIRPCLRRTCLEPLEDLILFLASSVKFDMVVFLFGTRARPWRAFPICNVNAGLPDWNDIRLNRSSRLKWKGREKKSGLPDFFSLESGLGPDSCGWGGRIRTYGKRLQRPLSYHLTTPHRERGSKVGRNQGCCNRLTGELFGI